MPRSCVRRRARCSSAWTGAEAPSQENAAHVLAGLSTLVVARSPDRVTRPTEGLQEAGGLRSSPVAGRETPRQREPWGWHPFPRVYGGVATYGEPRRWTPAEYMVWAEQHRQHGAILQRSADGGRQARALPDTTRRSFCGSTKQWRIGVANSARNRNTLLKRMELVRKAARAWLSKYGRWARQTGRRGKGVPLLD